MFNKTFATILLLGAILAQALPASAYYSPTRGRFLSRDPVGYADGEGLYEYVDSAPVRKTDPKGLWGKNIHKDATEEWGILMQMDPWAMGVIAETDQRIDDSIWTGVTPFLGDLGRHLDTGNQSQLRYWREHRQRTTDYIRRANNCSNEGRALKYCKKAAKEFGKGLHSLQDTSSHRPPFGVVSWPPFRIHPSWRDYYGTLPTEDANSMGKSPWILGNDWHDDEWAEVVSENPELEGGVYDVWKNTPEQVESQRVAQTSVFNDTQAALRGLMGEVRTSCPCSQYFLTPLRRISIWTLDFRE